MGSWQIIIADAWTKKEAILIYRRCTERDKIQNIALLRLYRSLEIFTWQEHLETSSIVHIKWESQFLILASHKALRRMWKHIRIECSRLYYDLCDHRLPILLFDGCKVGRREVRYGEVMDDGGPPNLGLPEKGRDGLCWALRTEIGNIWFKLC